MKKEETKAKSSDEPGGRKRERIVRIFNLSEDVWPFIEAMGDERARLKEIEENANLADRDLFSMAEEFEFTFIAPKKFNPLFVEYFKKLCLVREMEVLVPKKNTGIICEDILGDKAIMKKLVRMGRSYKRLAITSYSTSPYFLNLVSKLRSKGIDVRTPEAPEEANAWTVNFYGSKSGIRQLTQINGAIRADLKMPEGVVSSGVLDSVRIAANKYIKEGGVVIKTNKGHSGMGVLIFRKGDLPKKYRECQKKIVEILNRDGYWEKFPIVVESLIKPNPRIGGGFPNAEFVIKKDGEVKLLYCCGMRVSEKGIFGGVEIGEEVLPKRVASRITDIGYLIGEQYVEDGYRGYFDIDFIAGKGGEIFVNESNVRVTGGTHAYQAAVELAGREFMKKVFVLSNNMYDIPNKNIFTFEKLQKLMKPLLFDRKTREGLVIASSNLLAMGKLAYIIFGKNKRRAIAIEEEMKKLLT
ncbi:hypothetical protein D4S03_11555 [bacterium]|nr:MAG: hypothetical protein D4S03_11555 [bacterium]